jgi:esterase/lipase superfamily enzyme
MTSRAISSCANRRFFLKSLTAFAAAGASACVPDLMANSVAPVRNAVTPPPGYDPTLLTVTNRSSIHAATKSPWYGHGRENKASVTQVVFHRPDTSLIGRAGSTWNGTWNISKVSHETRPLSDALLERVSGREVLLYIHGYKESFESSAISGIELAEGTGFSGVPMLFSWPSKAALFDYGYDRESALYSRDALEETLLALLGEGSATRVHIVAHSMGTLLLIETLRQIWARHGDLFANRIGALLLASADIDLDLFTNATQRLRSLVPKITVISSTSDRALAVSRRLAGGIDRTGGANRDQLEGLGVRVVDATDHGGWAVIKHDLFLSDSEVRQVVRRSIERGRA